MCVWYLKVWPLSTWVPARQQVVGSPTLRDYLVLLLIFFFIGVELWFTRMEFVSWRWCRLVFDFYILDGSYVTLLPWPVFPLICLRSDLIAWKIRFPVLSITASLHIIHPYADVQIDRVFQTLIKVWPFSAWVPARQQVEGSLALRDYLSSTFVFSFLLKWSCGSQGWNSFLEGNVVLSSTSKF